MRMKCSLEKSWENLKIVKFVSAVWNSHLVWFSHKSLKKNIV